MSAPSFSMDQTDIVRKRRFAVRSIEDVTRVLNLMKLEGFQGFIRVNIGRGKPVSVEAEERAKMETIDKLP